MNKVVVNNAKKMSKNGKNENQCYWCGEIATGTEHVPPQNLFPKGFRKELITVKSCRKHNEDLSKIDERMRINIIMLSHTSKVARKLFEEKILKGIKREKSAGLGISVANTILEKSEGGGYVKVKSEHLNIYIEKIVRGLFYHIYGNQLSGTAHHLWNNFNDLSLSANAHFYYFELEEKYAELWIDGNCMNKEVFDYKYHYCNKEKQFFVIMKLYETHRIIGISIPKGKNIENYGVNIEKYINKKTD